MQECLRDSECPADELGRLLRQELELAKLEDNAEPDAILETWPNLPALLGRAANVLRPPPGAAAQTTAANAVALILDVAEHALQSGSSDDNVCLNAAAVSIIAENVHSQPSTSGKCDDGTQKYLASAIKVLKPRKDAPDAEGLAEVVSIGQRAATRPRENGIAMIRALRGIVGALQGGDVTSAVVELESVLESAVIDQCEDTGSCKDPPTVRQLRRGFRGARGLGNLRGELSPARRPN